jgi:NAD(P)H-hydrate repair Nnr-like enzyme with NAD(P)H-hydrate dehydratase domain
LIGSGVAGDEDDPGQLRRAKEALDAAREAGLPAVVDAGGLELLPEECPPNWILTPHAGELAALLGRRGPEVSREDVEARPLHFARMAAETTGATVLLKGATTVVASPSGMVFSQSEGTPWMATAGSGDTLGGILGSLLAQLAEGLGGDEGPFAARGIAAGDRWAAVGAMAASLHGFAGISASQGGSLTAGAIARAVPGVLRNLHSKQTLDSGNPG